MEGLILRQPRRSHSSRPLATRGIENDVAETHTSPPGWGNRRGSQVREEPLPWDGEKER